MADLMTLIRRAGFSGDAARTMYAIVMAESGGNARAHNPNAGTGDNSYGLAQINMLGDMGPERRRQFGLKTNDDLFDPETNLRVAFALSNGGKNFSPWTTYTRGTYKQYLGQTGATVTTNSAGVTPLTGDSGGGGVPAPKLTSSDYREALGELSGLLTGVPELKTLLAKAVKAGWSVAKFQQSVQGSKWYRTHNAQARALISQKYSDPKEYATRVQNAQNQVTALANQMGVRITSPTMLNNLATMFLVQGWDQTELQHQLGKRYDVNDTTPDGQAATFYGQLKELYDNMGVPTSGTWLRTQVKRLLSGEQTMDAFQQRAVAQAQSLYPAIAANISASHTVRDIAEPYMQTMANLLELNPASIKLSDPSIKQALQGTTTVQGGKQTVFTTTLNDFEKSLRGDPRWQYTRNAKDTVSSALVNIGRTFGFGPQG